MAINKLYNRKKLYKSGKMLVTASVISIVGLVGVSTNVQADTIPTAVSHVTNLQPGNQADNDQDTTTQATTQAPVEQADATKDATPQAPVEQADATKDATPQASVEQADATKDATTQASVEQADATKDATTQAPVEQTDATKDATTQAPVNQTDATKDAITRAPIEQANATKDATTQAPVDQTDATKDAKTQAPVEQTDATKDATTQAPIEQANATKDATPKAPVDQTDATKDATTPSDVKANQTNVTRQEALNSDTNIKTIDGKSYFYDANGQVKKNFTAIVQGHVFYFDKTTGVLTSNDKQYSDDLVNITNDHNAAYDATTNSFENVDGYLTANSWYRPKEILKDGTTWTASQSTDLRPILMTWWPDKSTQVSYLNYLDSKGILSNQQYTENDSTTQLTDAAMVAQANIEKQIGHVGNVDWLKSLMTQYIDSQENWNINSESKGDDHLQGGALLYVNSDQTPDANSDYRKLNRTPLNQKGEIADKYKQGGFELLLANDVDNSNPTVQAEQLNWLHYMMNIGSILKNDPTANFDGYRVDAVDNVDADLLQIAGSYAKAAYGIDKNNAAANQHLSILEDWGDQDSAYIKAHGNEQITMDFPIHLAMKYALNMPLDKRSGLEPTRTYSLVDRTSDNSEDSAQPNYSFIRAHDSEVQTIIADIIKDKINPESTGLDSSVTLDQLKQAFEIYNADELKADKVYTPYNIPSSYALLLTNKDTIPRVYYGDLFTDDGQYMAAHSPYYDAIDALLKARVQYVAGGQAMDMTYLNNSQGVMTSVRYGKGAMNATDTGSSETRTQGIGVVISNQPTLKLAATEKISLNMGAAHKNQAYRPVLLTTSKGLQIYTSDADATNKNAPIVYTDGNGILSFDSKSVFGVNDPQVSGYIAAWVPMFAAQSQDARTESSTTPTTDGSVYHSNAALDSQVIYEGFSNFQDFPTTAEDFTNVKIAQNISLFKSWGVTSFELAPQYRSSSDNSFIDSLIQNGYAFTDRYDIGYNTPTKYGTSDNLLDALRALHSQGIQAINDWVPDQIYNLPGEQIVSAIRTDGSGEHAYDSEINHTLYDSKTVGGGEYQKQYGGAFLETLQEKYPELFKEIQISNGKAMDPSVKISEWSAKYFNGSNIQGRGAWYVLKDWGTNQYFTVSGDNKFLPKQLLGERASTGFVDEAGQTLFYTTSGYQAKSTFIEDNNNWYYFDEQGYMVVGNQSINDTNYYFLPNGVELRDAYLSDGNKTYYYNKLGKQIQNQYYLDNQKNWRYFFEDGQMAQGIVTITSSTGKETTQYFDDNGIQQKGVVIKDQQGKLHYFNASTGDMVINDWGELSNGAWVYLDKTGVALVGKQVVNGQIMYFNEDGTQVKNDFKVLPDGSWLYLGETGAAATGKQTINGQTLYFNDDGKQIKNSFKKIADNEWLYLNDQGVAVIGQQIINGQQLMFGNDGIQIKGHAFKNELGELRYYDANSGNMITNRFEQIGNNQWAYFGSNGAAVTGEQTINGQELYFDDNGVQFKGEFRSKNGKLYYYDPNTGELVKNRFVQLEDGSWVYFGKDGAAVTGIQKINGQKLYFDNDGKQVKGQSRTIGKVTYWMDTDSGVVSRINNK